MALGDFQQSQSALRLSSPEAYVDPLAAVEYCERALPRLYLAITASAVILEEWVGAGGGLVPFGTLMFEGPEGLLADLDGLLAGVRSPLPGIYLRLYAVMVLSPFLLDTELVDRVAVEAFLMGCYKDMLTLWTRWRPVGQEARRHELADLVLAPLRSLAQLDCPDVEQVLMLLVESDDALTQELVFTGIVDTFSSIAIWLPACLSALSAFKPQVNRYASLQHLLKRALSRNPTDIKQIWADTEPILDTIQWHTESQLISFVDLFLEPLCQLESTDASVIEAVFALLDRRISDKTGNENWSQLLTEMTKRTVDSDSLLESESFVTCICRNTVLDLSTTVHLITRVKADNVIAMTKLLSSVFSRTVIEKHERTFLEAVEPIRNISMSDALLEALLSEAKSSPEHLAICYYAPRLSTATDDAMPEALRDLKIAGVDSVDFELQLRFGRDAPIYQFILVSISQMERFRKERDESGLYHCFSKAILACERPFDSSSIHHRALTEIISSLADEQLASLLRPQDLEVLLANLLRIATRQLDTRQRAAALLGLVQVAAGRRSLSADLCRSLLSHGLQSVRSLSQPRDQPLQLALIKSAVEMFSVQADGLVRVAEELNEHFWGLRDRLAQDCLPEYHQLWAQWTELVPKGKLDELITEDPVLQIADETAPFDIGETLEENVANDTIQDELIHPDDEEASSDSTDGDSDSSASDVDEPSALSKALANIQLDEGY